ncbi:MAG TPA: alpha-2-macroglobulin family protein, partial [Pyrinomonadaceae bacterium]
NIAGVTRRDVERIDPARPLPDGFDAVAEMIYNNERPYELHRVTTGTDFEREQSRVFKDLVKAQLSPLTEALDARYKASAGYPADDAALVRALAQAGVEFAALRDPWGRPFRTKFYFERQNDVLELLSGGADKRPGTDDDFVAARFDRPYFRKTGEAIDRAVADFHKRTGGHVLELPALREEMRRAGIGDEAVRDRWGRPYDFKFETAGTYHVITVRSASPNRIPEQEGDGDDFEVWKVFTDYFEESRKAVDAALYRDARAGHGFPSTRGELASALARSSLKPEDLTDGWGRPAYPVFSKVNRFTDRVGAEGRGAEGAKRKARPVTQTLYALTLMSAGPDRREGTRDDFTLAYYTSLGEEQTAEDSAPVPAARGVTFSGGTGAVTGTVIDPQGAVISGATVTAKHNFVDFEASTTTDDNGLYLLRNLPSGVYTLKISSPGFVQFTLSGVRVLSSNLTKVDATLSVGAVAEAVTVTAGADTLNQTVQTSVAATVSEKRLPVMAPLSTPRLREFFPETLVWSPELETARDGTARLNFKLADNITTWKMSVIASTEDGRLGSAESEFLAFQPFFVEHDPPRVLTEGDEIQLPVVLRNYLAARQGVDVEMKPERWFALAGASKQHADVASGDAARPVFDFRAVASVSDGKQRVTALGSEASDAVEKPVTVHPDGEPRSATDGKLLTDAGALGTEVPADVVRGSVRGELKVYPNLTTHVIEGVEAIMSRPYGCGEQTISSAYPSVLMLDYGKGLKGGAVDAETL